MPLLEVKNLHVHYGAIHALHGINITVEAGQIVTLIGANGAGKSTTLRAISGMLRPSNGSITFDGTPIIGVPAHEIVRMGIAHAPEGRGIFANMTVEENLSLGAFTRTDHAAIEKDRERALQLFPRVRERLKQNAGTLSGGEQQMLAIGRALMTNPRLLVMDEPSEGLAPAVLRVIRDRLQELRALGLSVLVAEQNVDFALALSDRVAILGDDGTVAWSGPSRTLVSDPGPIHVHLGL